METKVDTAHVPLELASKVDAIAARPGIWVAQEEERYRLTQKALVDVDTGKTIDHDEVENWVESLDTDKPLPVPSRG
ncbi:MAG TPA: CopG family transcriptional regulator [Steroidobacteraceae bacterium]|jgi:hypothetical protein|nr:CopG family transcriptional regulator [Steroidobacteraceae bacterium]